MDCNELISILNFIRDESLKNIILKTVLHQYKIMT